MQTIGKTLKTLNIGTPIEAEAPKISKPVLKAFDDFNEMFGTAEMGRMFVGIEPTNVMETWSRYLAGFTQREIDRGLAAASRLKFMPRLGEFAQACRPCLDPEYAWHEAGACLRQRDDGNVGDWSHPAVWRAACTLSMEVRSGDYSRNRAQWAFELGRELEKGFGDGIPIPLTRIEAAPAVTKPPNEEIRAKLKALRAGM